MFLPFKGMLHDAVSFLHSQAPTPDGRRGPCADMELNYVECLEAYGLVKGGHMCEKYAEDMQECFYGNLQFARVSAMHLERCKKIMKGELPVSKINVDPIPYDAYLFGSFTP